MLFAVLKNTFRSLKLALLGLAVLGCSACTELLIFAASNIDTVVSIFREDDMLAPVPEDRPEPPRAQQSVPVDQGLKPTPLLEATSEKEAQAKAKANFFEVPYAGDKYVDPKYEIYYEVFDSRVNFFVKFYDTGKVFYLYSPLLKFRLLEAKFKDFTNDGNIELAIAFQRKIRDNKEAYEETKLIVLNPTKQYTYSSKPILRKIPYTTDALYVKEPISKIMQEVEEKAEQRKRFKEKVTAPNKSPNK